VVIEVLAADAEVAMSVRIVSPAEDSRIRDIVRKDIAQPVNAIRSRPRLLSVSVQAMDRDDADGNVRTGIAAGEKSLLDDWVDPFCHNL
jgi:hypothetical protein